MIDQVDPFRCPEGGAHQLVYLGRKRQLYRCMKCAEKVSKMAIGQADDDA